MKKVYIYTVIIPLVLNAILAIYLFVLSEKKGEPVYSIIKSPSLIYDKTNSGSKIKLLLNDSLSITDNVYITTIAIWNKGKETIKKEDLRKDFYIYCSDSLSYILDYRILQENLPGISNFKLTPVGDSLRVDWDYFDPDYGVKLQLIYSSVGKAHVVVSGSVLGSDLRYVVLKAQTSIFALIILFILSIFIIGVILFLVYSMIEDAWFKKSKSKIKNSALIGILVPIILLFIVYFYISKIMPFFFGIEVPF